MKPSSEPVTVKVRQVLLMQATSTVAREDRDGRSRYRAAEIS